MKISLDLIKPSPHPVRTNWDEEKMEELVQSIREQGLIVPIKVRPVVGLEWLEPGDQSHLLDEPFNGDMFEIVYGHRRVEACKRAGLTEIEAIVEGVDDTDVLIQALIENIQREDMNPIDKAKALKALQEKTGWPQREIEKRGIMTQSYVSRFLRLLDEPEEIQQKIISKPGGGGNSGSGFSEQHIRVTRQAQLNDDDRYAVLEKTEKEGLSYKQTERVAKAIKEAPTPQAKKRLLEMEYSPVIHDPELIRTRRERFGAHDPIYRDGKPSPGQAFASSPEIKMLLEAMSTAIQTFVQLMIQIKNVTDIGKLAPEGKQFMAHKLRTFRKQIDDLLEELED